MGIIILVLWTIGRLLLVKKYQTHVIQKEVSDLSKIIDAFEKGFKDLENRHNKNSETIQDLKTSVSKITNTSQKIQNLDLENKKTGEK